MQGKKRFSCKRVLTKTTRNKGETPMKMKITVAEPFELIHEIRGQPENLFEMIREDVKQTVDRYMPELMDVKLTGFLGRNRYERKRKEESSERFQASKVHVKGHGRGFSKCSQGSATVTLKSG